MNSFPLIYTFVFFNRVPLLMSVMMSAFCSLYVFPDYYNYYDIYNELKLSNWSDIFYGHIHGEYGFLFVSKFSSFVGLNYDLFRLIFIILMFYLKLIACKYLKVDLFLFSIAYVTLFLFMEVVAIRQGMATSFIAMCFASYYVGRPLSSVLFAVLAIFFHKISLACILIFFIAFFWLNFSLFIRVVIVSIPVLLSFIVNFDVVVMLDFFGLSDLFKNVVNYAYSEYGYSRGRFSGAVIFYFLIWLSYLIFYIINKNNHDYRYGVVLLAISVGLFWLVSFSSIAILSERGFRIFSFFYCLAISLVLPAVRPVAAIYFVALVIFFILFFFINNIYFEDDVTWVLR